MSAPDTKSCEVCTEAFTRDPARENQQRWSARRYCSRTCMGVARRKVDKLPPVRRKRSGTVLPIERPRAPRIENGVWRPNAPGWPARPHIPARVRSDVSA